MDHSNFLTIGACLIQPAVLIFSWFIVQKYELAKPKKTTKTKFISLGPTLIVAYNSPSDYEVWDLEVQSNGYQTNAPYKDVTDLCTENAKRVISEEIIRREKIWAYHNFDETGDARNNIYFNRAPKLYGKVSG